jgi:hypothetical protein
MLRWDAEEAAMGGTQEWQLTGPEKLALDADASVAALDVHVVGGAVNVVGTEPGTPPRLEVTALDGPPLVVRLDGGTLTVGYDDLSAGHGLLRWLDRRSWRRTVEVSVAVPQDTTVSVGVVGAGLVVSGLTGPATVRGVNGDVTLTGLAGRTTVETVSGGVEAQSVSGDLRFSTVSGDLTVVDGSGSRVKAESVSGSMALDLDPRGAADVSLATVSGEIAVRIPDPGDTRVDAGTSSGSVSCAFDEVRVCGQFGAKKLSGVIGTGGARLRATTVSGSIALLRRPAREDHRPDGATAGTDGPGAPAGTDGPGDPAAPTGDAPPGGGPASGAPVGDGPDTPSLRKDA